MAGESKYNMNHSQDENLKMKADNPEEMKAGLNELISSLDSEDSPLRKALMKSKVGVYSLCLREFENADKYLISAIEDLENLKQVASLIVAKIRLATSYHYQERYGKCDKILNECLKTVTSSSDSKVKDYEDFVLQHLGKSKLDQKLYGQAENYLIKAHDIRVQKGNLELMESTQKALSRLNELRGN